ncbi:ABC transporter ATP-binding protein [Sinomicrobium soli]|uniref:ABC transporter ATP-binding protein n=1 Tax=Sinomicrobium sp. N-1-3-6 TaxID=2219864 RepID=UPI000DCB619A|nr:ABC transporter ATP-binding protein [Sinomicrobium sp. N-1-3-6]RAV27594.1 ABC transporter ATP-binding protein [Sinomicrobium sp. N-1-3-6]
MLEVKGISFGFSRHPVLRGISFSLAGGQILSVIGESGSGKSTLLKALYGLYDLDGGTIRWKEKKILGPAYNLVPGEPYIKYLAQDFDLMPYISVRENIGKHLSNFYPGEKARRISELLDIVELSEHAGKKPGELSGGQQQRVALARAMAQEPELLLLDEPFSHIDSFRTSALRRNLFSFIRKKGITCIIASHDSVDALSFADKTLVMKNGEIIREDSPQKIYSDPDSYYTASLFGEVNEIPVSQIFPELGTEKNIFIYAHELHPDEASPLKIRVKASYFEGSHYLIRGLHQGKTLFFSNPNSIPAERIIAVRPDIRIVKERLNTKNGI